MENVPVATTNLAAEKAAALLKLFPECAGERGEVDFEKLKQTLADHVIEGDVERYQFTWPGKRAAMAEANVPTTKTLAPCEEESVDFAKTQNLYIEGDNLEVLKILRASYLGKVKMIYIDPPYNTGHDFVYHDRFAITQEEADQRGGNVDDLGRRFTENSESNPRYHSDWCSMMYPRLKLARDLLRDDGVIFISIDDSEANNLKKICDELFGETNFVAQISVVANPRGRDYGGVAKMHEYVFVYRKTDQLCLSLIEDDSNEFPFTDVRGGFELRELRNRNVKFNKGNRPNLYYPFYIKPNEPDENGLYDISLGPQPGWIELYPIPSQGINVVWRWGKDKAAQNLNKEIKAKKMQNGGFMIVEKYRESRKMARSVWWDKESNTERGTLEVKILFNDKKVFDYPKPVAMLERMVEMSSEDGEENNDVVLDFFSGSAATAHAVMQLNAEDGGHRKFILVQLPEVCAEDSEAAKAGYKNICEIGKERIRRAGKKIVEELKSKSKSGESKSKSGEVDLFSHGERVEHEEDADHHSSTSTSNFNSLDIGFRVLKLVESPMVDASKPAGETTQAELSFSSVKDGVKDDALLFHTMLRLGIAPTDTIEYKTIEGNKVACVGGVQLVAALDARMQMTNAFIEAIAKMNPGVAVFRDDTFRNNNALRISLEQTFKQLSKETKIEVI